MVSASTETRHPASEGLHQRTAGDVLAILLDAQIAALGVLRPALPALEAAAEAAAATLGAGGRLAYAGAGSSGLMALADCLELAGTFGIALSRTPMLFAGGTASLNQLAGAVEDKPDRARQEVAAAGIGAGDMVLVLSASGRTPYALAIAREARERGVRIAGFANAPGTPLLGLAEFPVLLDTGAEVITGSTRLGAATAQKVALNLLSVLVGIRLGHVHDGFMVNLHADNAKLVDRAARVVMAVAGVDRAAAEAAIAATAGAVKPAILVARGMTPDAARAALERSGGHLALLTTQKEKNQHGEQHDQDGEKTEDHIEMRFPGRPAARRGGTRR